MRSYFFVAISGLPRRLKKVVTILRADGLVEMDTFYFLEPPLGTTWGVGKNDG